MSFPASHGVLCATTPSLVELLSSTRTTVDGQQSVCRYRHVQRLDAETLVAQSLLLLL